MSDAALVFSVMTQPDSPYTSSTVVLDPMDSTTVSPDLTVTGSASASVEMRTTAIADTSDGRFTVREVVQINQSLVTAVVSARINLRT